MLDAHDACGRAIRALEPQQQGDECETAVDVIEIGEELRP
jgi:hypothetical protein